MATLPRLRGRGLGRRARLGAGGPRPRDRRHGVPGRRGRRRGPGLRAGRLRPAGHDRPSPSGRPAPTVRRTGPSDSSLVGRRPSCARASVWKNRLNPSTAGVASAVDVEVVGVDRVHDDVVAVRAVAGRGSGADVAGEAAVVAQLHRALGQLRRVLVAGAAGQLGDRGRDVGHRPVPEAARRGRVGVVDGDGEALRALREARPATAAASGPRRRRP